MGSILGNNISAARRAAGLSTAELARSIGLSDQELCAIEHGSRRVSAKEVYRISKRLNVDIYLFFDTNNQLNTYGDCSGTAKSQTQDDVLKILKNLRLNRTLEDLRELSNSAADQSSGANKAA